MTQEQLIAEVQKINPAINCFPAGDNTIEGNHRGKKSEQFKFNCETLEFEYNNASSVVAAAFEQAIKNGTKKTINVQGLDTIFVTGSMEEMEKITPLLVSLGFTQIKDRPNAYEFKTGIDATSLYHFDIDPKITYMGMPISEETAKKISEALIEEVKLKIIA